MTAHIPEAAAAELQTRYGLTADQCDTILQLICLPENGEPNWWNHYNYIEKLGDGRGFTVTIFGACSGTGDLLMIFDALKDVAPQHQLLKYHDALKKCRGEDVKGIQGMLKDIPALGDDKAWQTAVWKVYANLYWKFAMRFAGKKKGCEARPGPVLTTTLAKGFLVDTAINHGADLDSFNKILKRMERPDHTDETAWLLDFMQTRQKMLKSGFEHLDTSKTGDRCKLWAALLKEGNTSLARPIKASKGYWGQGVTLT